MPLSRKSWPDSTGFHGPDRTGVVLIGMGSWSGAESPPRCPPLVSELGTGHPGQMGPVRRRAGKGRHHGVSVRPLNPPAGW